MGSGKGWYNDKRYAGQVARITFDVEAAVEEGDAVGAVPATSGMLGRGADGDEIAGVVQKLENDDSAAIDFVGSCKAVTVERTGAITNGWQPLALAGDGTIKAGVGTREFFVIGTQTVSSVTYVTFIL